MMYISLSLIPAGKSPIGELKIGAIMLAPKVIGWIQKIKNGSLISGIYFTTAGATLVNKPSVIKQSTTRVTP